jgi:hypothetical protein
MIMFLPGRRAFPSLSKNHVERIISGAFVFLLVFFPFILAGHFVDEFKQAYVSSVESYPYAAFECRQSLDDAWSKHDSDSRPLFENGQPF